MWKRVGISCALGLLSCLGVFSVASAQSVTAGATFDVASVRPSSSDSEQRSNVPLDSGNIYTTLNADSARTPTGGLLLATHQPLWRYISFAYSLSGTQELSLRFSIFSGAPQSGAPLWVTGSFTGGAETFDISARAPANTSLEQMRVMMQALLADRFRLRTAWITTDTPVFALERIASGAPGPMLKPHSVEDACTGSQTLPSLRGPAGTLHLEDLPAACGVIARVPSVTSGQERYGGRGVTLALLASSIPSMTGLAATNRPVIDQTGLNGLYDFSLTWLHDALSGDSAISENTANIREALKQQLGLVLRPARASIPYLIVKSVERPSPN